MVVRNISKKRKHLVTLILLSVCGSTFYFLLTRLGLLMPLSELPSVLCLNSCSPERPVHPVVRGKQLLNNGRSLRELLGNNIDSKKVSILIEKSKYKLTLFYNFKPIKSYPVVFGSNPNGDKLYEGDQKTPEGLYHIRDLYSHPDWSKFIWLDYPTPHSWREHFQAKLGGTVNLFLPIGGQVGIHGVPSGGDDLIENRSNWTWGCISLKNHDVNEIYPTEFSLFRAENELQIVLQVLKRLAERAVR
ncbi:L,D-transpeptidase [Kovacikia minuta CCNUW1]|uniref:L,D-transpeptidase family protein n=1 Tax=Kovacikia minuta TaxID=2931930 RepID=UPI001CCE2BA3|nr:L,D-transpeptidase [Kovacikia minuta]UBF25996.1 L,D-transpeptidase [Kovacikia minuta CCNUW1]